MEVAEDLLTDAFYHRLFSNEEDESKDLDLQRAIRAFHWIGPAMLGAKLDRSRLEVSQLMDQAVNGFLQTNSALLPREKIDHLSQGVSLSGLYFQNIIIVLLDIAQKSWPKPLKSRQGSLLVRMISCLLLYIYLFIQIPHYSYQI